MDSYIILSAATSFAAFIGCLIGYHIRERRHGAAMVELQRLHEEGCVRMVRRHEEQFSRQVTASNNTLNLLAERVDCANADAETLRPYKDAIKHCLIVNHLNGDGTAFEQIDRLLAHETMLALDPAVSKPAKNLIIRAKREHGKKLRARHERALQILRDKARGYEELHNMAEEECVKLQQTLDLRRSALLNTTRDKLRLNGVRTAFIHAYWEEVARLRTVVKQTEETK